MTKILLLDVDGVCANFTKAYLEAIEEVTGRVYTVSQVTQWDIAKSIGLTDEEKLEVTKLVKAPGFCKSLELLPGAEQFVFEARAKGARVVFVTSPFESSRIWCYERRWWLEKRLDAEPRNDVVQTGAKDLIRGDVFVDDKPEAVAAWARANPGKAAFVWASHHNGDYRVALDLYLPYTNNWDDVLAVL